MQEAHPLLLSSGVVKLLPYILLPLCGPEEFDIEEQEKMPEEIQLLPPDKQREADSGIRLMLVEALVLLSATQAGRDVLRDRGVYEVVKVLHRVERDENVRIAVERLVNLLMREESQEKKMSELESEPMSRTEAGDEDMTVQEV